MKGLLVAERYYKFFGLPMIKSKFPDYLSRVAIGLVGEGSECFGFDDEQSRDHDWGPGFCIWLNSEDYSEIGPLIQREYNLLPPTYAGIPQRINTEQARGRIGVLETYAFYEKFTKLKDLPEEWYEWISIPEESLSACTNGRIFHDEFGEFSFVREKLLEFYPPDVRLKKIADNCIKAAREGQYNYLRCINRGEVVAADHAESIFVNSVIKIAFLLNWRFAPFYKWSHRALYYLPILGVKLHVSLRELIMLPTSGNLTEYYNRKVEMIEAISGILLEEIKRQQLSDVRSNYLLDHVKPILGKIENSDIRNYIP
ncbi:MAG: DUF4037 domain-containing protein [Bacteroidetes bacterium]|nr:DUF4037 domain-containing protein [Bacteroidota bacterium]